MSDPTARFVPPVVAAAPALRRGGLWQVRLLGGLEIRNGDVRVRRFASRPIAALLARLALAPDRMHPREELVELLWPGVDLETGRNRLRNALSSLRRVLEPPGSAAGSVLVADRAGVRLAPHSTRCDALEFERCMREGRYEEARRLDAGELLPGYYDDWVQTLRAHYASWHERLESIAAPTAPAGIAASTPAPRLTPPRIDAPPQRQLPGYLTSYFGREEERDQLAAQLAVHRLVTVTGPGGAGKTRLGVEVASALGDYDRITFADLTDCADGVQCATQLRVSLQLPAGAGEPLDAVVAFLASGRTLLLLDNFEQLVTTGGVEIVAALLARAPRLHLLLTSRRALGLPGEREFALPPLPPPDLDADLHAVARNPSVALFVDRARGVRPDFQVTERNRAALASLCRALEGLPLAIELAASRSRAYTPQDMQAALAERYAWLARPGRGAGPERRHDSLRAAIDWSWQLLDARQQRFLRALSVFRGGWSAISAQAICDESQAHARLEELSADSLLRAEPDAGGAMRFGMLEMIRDFLRDQLDAGEATTLRRRHRAHYLATALDAQARGPGRVAAAELPNLTEALRTAVEDGEHALALELGLALQAHWEREGIAPEALTLLARALDAAAPQPGTWAACCTLVALLSLAVGDTAAAQRRADAALEQSPAGTLAQAAALCARVRILSESRRDAAGLVPQLETALEIARRLGSVDLQARGLGLMSMLVLRQKTGPEQADRLAAEARGLYQSIGRDREASAMLQQRTLCLMEMQRYEEALAQARTIERESIDLGDRPLQLRAINQQGVLQARLRRWADALEAYRRCAQLAWEVHNHYWLAFALWNHCRNLARLRRPEPAALLMAFSERYWVTHYGALAADDLRFVRQVRALVAHQVGTPRLDALWDAGVRLSSADALRIACA